MTVPHPQTNKRTCICTWKATLLGLLFAAAAMGASAQSAEAPASKVSFLRGDQYRYVLQVIDSARSGHASTKYEVWRILATCKRSARQFEKRSALEAKRSLPAPYAHALQRVDELYELCGHFYANGFREFPDVSGFRMEAASLGFPPAVVDVAISDLMTSDASIEDVASRIAAAINTGHPETLIVARTLQLLNVIDHNTSLAFVLAACGLGYDCGRNGPLMRELCWSTPSCLPDDTFASLVERELGTSVLREGQLEAAEIQAEIFGRGISRERFQWNALDRQATLARNEMQQNLAR